MIELTTEQKKQFKEMYDDLLRGGIIMGNPKSYYVVDGKPVDASEEWDRRIKALFGEDSELTKELLTKKVGFITGKPSP